MTHKTKGGLPVRVLDWGILCRVQDENGRIFHYNRKWLTPLWDD